ncbi:MAG: choice-of-anchor J domain-containing protein [Bacteroidales bacterium]|nr:choice-of-anchor J domain-containing protein [Bacteroidales bacterium]
MKRLLMLVLCSFAVLSAMSQNYAITYSDKNGDSYIEFSIKNYKLTEISRANGTFTKIAFGKNVSLEKMGWAELPFASTTIDYSDGDLIAIDTSKSEYHELTLPYPILPSRGTVYRDQNPDSIPYIILAESISDGWYPSENIKTEPFSFRDETKVNIRIFPFQYNSALQTLRIYDRIAIKVSHSKSREITPLPNYDYGNILVITPERYDSALAPYIRWKREMGYDVTVMHCDSAENVTSKIAQAYSQNPNLLYVQLVGNWNDVQSNTLGTETCPDCPTDPALGCVSGGDDCPDLAIGRFVCANEEELSTQIQKSINYEKNPNNNRDWRDRFIGIGSGEGPGDDDELDYEHVRKIYDNRLADFTYNVHSQHYDEGTNVSSNALIASINVGASSIAYCGHGSGSYWLTGGYGSSNVTASSNGDKLPFVVSVACRNGAFHNGDCFADKWMNAKHGGAVATLMSSISQPWNPPMRGQDYFYDILSGGYNYDNDTTSNGLNTNEQRTHWGSVVLNAFYLMLCESAQQSDIETVKSWISFGDASLQLRTKTPNKIESSQRIAIQGNNFSTQITTNGQAVKNALVCISQDGNYYKGFTNSRGNVTIGHNLHEGKALLVVTAFNTTTIYDSIPVIESGIPYIEIDNYTPKSVSAGASTNLSISLQNLGTVQSDSVLIRISSDDEYLTINTDSAIYAPIIPNRSAENNSFDIQIPRNAPFGHTITLTANIEYNDTSIERQLHISLNGQECYAPDILKAEYTNDSCILTWNNLTVKRFTIFDDFEDSDDYPPFTINPEGEAGWSYYDGDDSQTGLISGYTFPNNREKMAFIAFRPEMAYSDTSNFLTKIHPHSGNQFLASFRSTTLTTNDWIFSRELDFVGDFEFSFYVRGSHQPSYWETMEVYYISDSTITRLDSCMVKGSADPDAWTLKTYQVPDSARYVAIRNFSYNKNFLCIDDIKISGYKLYPIEGIDIYDNGTLLETGISGDTLILQNLDDGEHCFSVRPTCNINLYTDTTVCITIFHEQCTAPENAICYITAEKDSIVWSPTENAIAYNIYESGQLVGNTTDTTFVINVSSAIEHNYTLSSVCSQGESETIEVQTTLVGNNGILEENTRIFPNPSNGNFTIEYLGNQSCEYIVNDLCGKNIAQGKLSIGQNNLNLQGFPNGMYIISILSDDTTHKYKIIKQ